MAIHSSILAWRIPWREEPGRLQSMGLQRVSHDWETEHIISIRAYQVALVVKNPPAKAGDVRNVGLIPGSGRSPGGGHGNTFQYSCLENAMDRGVWSAIVHGVAKIGNDWSDLACMHACMHSQSPDMKISLWVTLYFMETSLLLYRYQAFRGSPELCFTFLWSCFTPIGSFFTWYFYNSLQFSGFLFDSGTHNYGCLAQKKTANI